MTNTCPTIVSVILSDIERSHEQRDGAGHELPVELAPDYCFEAGADHGEKARADFEWSHFGLSDSEPGEVIEYTFAVEVDTYAQTLAMRWTHMDGEPLECDHDFGDAFRAMFPELWASMVAAPECAQDQVRHLDQMAADAACSF